ncbi:MAG: thioredoxin family protein [Actinobacteria bacterium]|nr:thioredoxin family protein [Actinomycetota bacterium]
MALANPQIRADIVEVSEFPELIQRYGVRGVPKTIINEEQSVVGAVPEGVLLAHVLAAAGVDPPADAAPGAGQATGA